MNTTLIVTGLALALSTSAMAQDAPEPLPSPSPTPGVNRWTINLFNVDDSMRVVCNGRQVGSVGYNQTATIDLNPCLTPGQRNDFSIEAINSSGGWTYGFRLLKNGDLAFSEQGHPAEGACGTVSRSGCKNNDSSTGVVFRKSYYFLK